MRTVIQFYNDILLKVTVFYKQMQLEKLEKRIGRTLAVSIPKILAMAIYKHVNGIPTKKSIFKTFLPPCSYKTLVVNMNRFAVFALLMIMRILAFNRRQAHIIKHTDATDIPVCLKKNGKRHKTMQGLAEWGNSGKGSFYGLKLHITTDLKRRILAIQFSTATADDREIFLKLNDDLLGIFVADAGYVSEKLQKDFHLEGKRILFTQPRKNMKKLITEFQYHLYNTRMRIELNFRSLKMWFCKGVCVNGLWITLYF
jgi:hypothetical protein